MKKRRNSRQRNRILKLLKGNPEHPTAQWVYDELRRENPNTSLGNVYRNLAILVEDGLIESRDFGDGTIHYDAITGPHYHFICEKCNNITDIEVPVQDEITKLANKAESRIIKSHTIQFFGICEKCSSN